MAQNVHLETAIDLFLVTFEAATAVVSPYVQLLLLCSGSSLGFRLLRADWMGVSSRLSPSAGTFSKLGPAVVEIGHLSSLRTSSHMLH